MMTTTNMAQDRMTNLRDRLAKSDSLVHSEVDRILGSPNFMVRLADTALEESIRLIGLDATDDEVMEAGNRFLEGMAGYSRPLWVDASEVSQYLRQHIEASFPDVEFGLERGRHKDGDMLSVTWVDGPSEEEVEEIGHNFEGTRVDALSRERYRVSHWGVFTVEFTCFSLRQYPLNGDGKVAPRPDDAAWVLSGVDFVQYKRTKTPKQERVGKPG